LIQDYYGDANKPFSELWNEEGFYFITNPVGQRRGRSQMYVLREEDHEKLFKIVLTKKRVDDNLHAKKNSRFVLYKNRDAIFADLA
jgi:hypothetical protein